MRKSSYIFFCLMLTAYSLQLFYPASASQVVDLTEIGIGAKPLGMGSVFNPEDNSGSLFQNPAALANIGKYSLTSMSGNVMGEVPYLMFGGAYRTNYGTIGVGYINASVGGIKEATLVNGVPEITGNEANYGSGTLLIGFAKDAKWNTKVGASLKFINQGFSGAPSFEGAGGGGFDLDLGTIIPINERLTGALTLKNIIPGSNMRGDELPLAIVGGLAYKVPDRNWLAAVDLASTTRGLLFHLGAEWNPFKQFFLRAGLDQKPDNINYSLGVGTRARGCNFDYAYHTYAGLGEMTTHYFSIGYVGEEPKVESPPPVAPKPVIVKPAVKKPGKAPVVIKKKVIIPPKKK